jgi:hypothetical protein
MKLSKEAHAPNSAVFEGHYIEGFIREEVLGIEAASGVSPANEVELISVTENAVVHFGGVELREVVGFPDKVYGGRLFVSEHLLSPV